MSVTHLSATTAVLLLISASAVLAGAPLKGVDVKLGRNPGGSPASRTTNADGVADFGVLPRGDYTLTVANGAPPRMHVSVTGAMGGRIERDLSAGGATARQTPVGLTASGRDRVIVVLSAE